MQTKTTMLMAAAAALCLASATPAAAQWHRFGGWHGGPMPMGCCGGWHHEWRTGGWHRGYWGHRPAAFTYVPTYTIAPAPVVGYGYGHGGCGCGGW